MYRQGDLLIVKIDRAPRSQRRRLVTNGVIQEGEATGHAHRLVNGEAWWDGADQFIASGGTATLTHDEHETITLPEGEYRVLRQREFTPEGERRVRD